VALNWLRDRRHETNQLSLSVGPERESERIRSKEGIPLGPSVGSVVSDRFLDGNHPNWAGHWESYPSSWDQVPEPGWLGRSIGIPFWLRRRYPFIVDGSSDRRSMIYGDYNIATAPYATFPPGSFTRSLRWRAILARRQQPD
jgi:hypothetical protein